MGSSLHTLRARLRATSRKRFNRDPALIVRAPGRINLIGEHTDYNQGYVLPAAINRWVMVGLSPRKDLRCRVAALDFDQKDSFSLGSIEKHDRYLWASYARGVAQILLAEGRGRGFDAIITGNVPIGTGLSSSAATEVALAKGLNTLWNLDLGDATLARLCNRVEREFLGVLSGIMDQFVSLFAKKDHAVFLDCRDLSYRYISLPFKKFHIAVLNPLIPRELAHSLYNRRVRECEDAVKTIRIDHPEVQSARDVTREILKESGKKLPPVHLKRLRHVISENERTLKAVDYLTNGRMSDFGNLLFESHRSLQQDYEVSREELDTLVALCADTGSCVGARMVGGGFGGCVMALVKAEGWRDFTRKVPERYQAAYGINPEITRLEVSSGAHTDREL